MPLDFPHRRIPVRLHLTAVSSGWAAMFDEFGLILSGAITALIYGSPLRDLFARPASSP